MRRTNLREFIIGINAVISKDVWIKISIKTLFEVTKPGNTLNAHQ